MSTIESLDLSKFPTKRVKFDKLVAVINPRTIEELDLDLLLPDIVEEKGQIVEPIIAWEPDDAFRKRFPDIFINGDEFVTIRGHRRHGCVCRIRAHKEMFTADVYENAGTVPVIIIKGITEERARNLTMDDKSKKGLCKFEVVMDVFRRFEADHNYQKVCRELTPLLYRRLLIRGEGKYKDTLNMDDGKERVKQQQTDLRNVVDQWLQSAHILGPAMKHQVVLWTKVRQDGRKLKNGDRLLFEAKPAFLTKLRSEYVHSKDSGWQPITAITFPEDEPISIEGGNTAVNTLLSQAMTDFRFPENATKDKPALPKATERDNVKDSSQSEVGKATAAFYCGLPSEQRAVVDAAAARREWKEAILREMLPTLNGSVKVIVDAIVNEKDKVRFKEVFTPMAQPKKEKIRN